MAYLRCTACGSKALAAASQCPKCAQPFNLLDARGDRVKLKRCRSCGIMHRYDASCHWCSDRTSSNAFTRVTVSGAMLRNAAAVALMLTAAGGAWRYAPALRDLTASLSVRANEAAVSAPVNATASERIGVPASTVASAATPGASAPPDTLSMVSSGDSIQWVPAVARTWVNVRSDASRGGEVVGVIKPASRAMLGTDRAGWRQVRSTEASGWVDPRLFEPDSVRSRGE